MKKSLIQWSAALMLLAAFAGCGGGGGDSAGQPGSSTPLADAIGKAAALPSNDTAVNASASFAVLQNAGVPAVTVNSPPVVKFVVFSDGKVKTGLTTANTRFAIAKLLPGISGAPDQWVSYVTKQVAGKPGFGPGGSPALASAPQASTDTAVAAQLVYNAEGYYTYTFSTDIKSVTGISYEPNRTHRVAIQLSYKNDAGENVLVNPYFDFTIVDGKSVVVTDPARPAR